jgi:hypothetical protein
LGCLYEEFGFGCRLEDLTRLLCWSDMCGFKVCVSWE